MNIKQANVIAVLGKRGSGKTILTEHIVSKLAAEYPVFVYDVVHNWTKSNYTQFRTINIHQMPAFGCCVFQEHSDDDFTKFTESFYHLAIGLNSNGVVYPFFLVFDEIYMHVDNSNLDAEDNWFFKRLLVIARNYGVGLIFVSQRPAIMNKTILTQADFISCFKVHHHLDTKALEEYFPAEKMQHLEDFHYATYDNRSGKVEYSKPVQIHEPKHKKQDKDVKV